MLFWQVHLWGPVTHCVRWGSLAPQWNWRFWGLNPQPKHAIANCSEAVSPMLPPGEYRRGVGWTCQSNSAFCQITLVLVFSTLITTMLVTEKASMEDSGVDALDAFMMSMKSGGMDSRTRMELKRRAVELRQQQTQLQRLAALARPCSLPPLDTR